MMNSSIFILLHLCSLPLFLICIHSSEILCIPNERQTLLKFKRHLIDHSNRLSSWNVTSNTNCCNWEGVVCSDVTSHIIQLHLNISPPSNTNSEGYDDAKYEAYERSMFGGEINPCLVDLKHLNYLDFSGNDFGGMQIPTFFGAITSLTYLNLHNAGFGGNIPYQIGNLSNLIYLDFSGNDFGGMQIPTFLGSITSLTYLNLSYAGFGGKIPHQIGNLSNLLYLDIGGNNLFYGEIPYQIGNLTNLVHLHIGSDDDYPSPSLFAKNLQWLLGLSKLEYLHLGFVNLSKSLDWLEVTQTLPSLVELHLPGCALRHYNQPSILNFSSLLTLDLSESYDLGTSFFPDWIFGLTKLVSLKLRMNNIQGSIPDGLQNLTLLQNLDLSYNSFSSSIPDWLFGLHHIKFLCLRFNNLNGTIPDRLGNMTSLVELDLSYNQFEGKIPVSLSNLCNLRQLGLSYLKLAQQVNEILEILTPCASNRLEYLIIPSSKVSGYLTDQIGNFKKLVRLILSDNTIHGTLPISFEKLSSLRYLDLTNNQFNGNPFESLKSLSALSSIDIYDNHFEGVVKEDDFANLTSLKVLIASGNNFSLKVGPTWHPSFQLTHLDMSGWQLGLNFPPWLQSQKHLQYLGMSNTGISDSMPTWFWKTCSDTLSYLNLSHNYIHGELVNIMMDLMFIRTVDLSSNQLHGKLPALSDHVSWLDLSSNKFSGSMTDFLCKRQNNSWGLELLNVASNNLSGKLPNCWTTWPSLRDVNLQSNYFVGNLPPSMGSLTKLKSLDIRNNSFSGIFPFVLKKTRSLISLDLGENNFSGIIPAWVGKSLLNMKILRLRSNRFFGHIPNEICEMISLQDLDLAQNNLYGNIPNCFNHLYAVLLKNRSNESFIESGVYNEVGYKDVRYSSIGMFLWLKGRSMEYRNLLSMVTNIDLSDNNLSGGIPREITELDGLHFLNLSKNHLTGKIPSGIGNMRSLECIDFSRNKLSGEIPPTITNLSFLGKLDLSYNHLKGQIPMGTQLQSFEASNFVGNNLCGPPLPVNCSVGGQNIPHNGDYKKESDGHKVNWFFVCMAFGFIVGFWVVVAPLFIYRSWRYAYFRFLDDLWFRLQSL